MVIGRGGDLRVSRSSWDWQLNLSRTAPSGTVATGWAQESLHTHTHAHTHAHMHTHTGTHTHTPTHAHTHTRTHTHTHTHTHSYMDA